MAYADNLRQTSGVDFEDVADYIENSPYILHSSITSTGNTAGAGNTTAYTYTLPASTLANNGESIRFLVYGYCAANSSAVKTIEPLFDSTSLSTANFGGVSMLASPSAWYLEGSIVRISSGSQVAYFRSILYYDADTQKVRVRRTALTKTLTNALDLVIRINGTSANDVVTESFKVIFEPA